MCSFSREIHWDRSQCCQNALGHAHQRRQPQPDRVQLVGCQCFQSECGTCFIYIFLLEARLKESCWCQNALGHAHRRRQRQPGRVQQVGSQCFQKECGTCFIYIFLLEARLKGSWWCQTALRHTHRHRQCQPGRVQQVGQTIRPDLPLTSTHGKQTEEVSILRSKVFKLVDGIKASSNRSTSYVLRVKNKP